MNRGGNDYFQLTPQQNAILQFIERSTAKNGYPPTRSEISEHFAFKSNNAAQQHVMALERKGYLKVTPHISRGIVSTRAA